MTEFETEELVALAFSDYEAAGDHTQIGGRFSWPVSTYHLSDFLVLGHALSRRTALCASYRRLSVVSAWNPVEGQRPLCHTRFRM